MKLSFYTPIAYDYKYAFVSIKSYYDIADEIILSIDKNRISWSGIKYDFDDLVFNTTIKEIDTNNKIQIFEENFYKYDEPILNDTYERNKILELCHNYTIGIDSDEILLNPIEFYNWMDEEKSQFDIECSWKTIYKKIDNKFLITSPEEYAVIGTNKIYKYKKCRITGNEIIRSPLNILHYSWGRTKEEIKQKLKNWGHSKEFNVEKYLNIWENVNLQNYKELKNFHPLKLNSIWKELEIYNI